ncbi:MAG: hypothetical protein ABS76_36560 [Pelagibacterium sp. SCN 64-44]|nr:MAG: hypothetical protein ABS76_36560 [Pelagibacterium sp. SCN 64-44]
MTFAVTYGGGIAIAPADIAEHADSFLASDLGSDGTKLPDHHPARPTMPAILDEEEAFAAWHHADAKSWELGIENDVVFFPLVEALDDALCEFVLGHSVSPFCCNLGDLRPDPVEASWKRWAESRGEDRREKG